MRQYLEISTAVDMESVLTDPYDADEGNLVLQIEDWKYMSHVDIIPSTLQILDRNLTISLELIHHPVIPLSILREGTVCQLAHQRILNTGNKTWKTERKDVGNARVTRRWFEPATHSGWSLLPSPDTEMARSLYRRRFSSNEYERIKLGITPESMDDHWYVYFEDDWLYCHHSWRGVLWFKVHVEAMRGVYSATEVFYKKVSRRKFVGRWILGRGFLRRPLRLTLLRLMVIGRWILAPLFIHLFMRSVRRSILHEMCSQAKMFD